MKVLVCSPGLSFQLDAPYSTRYRANAMVSPGADVTVVGFPPQLAESERAAAFKYVSVFESQSPARRERWEHWKRKLGPYWTFVIEPFLVKQFCYRFAVTNGFDLIYVTHPEPWIMLPLWLWQRILGRRIPTVVTIAGVFYMEESSKGRPLSSRIRARMNHFFGRILQHFMPVTFNSKYMLPALNIREHRNIHIIPEGHEDLIGTRTQAGARSKLGIPNGKRMILLFGVASKAKGADLLLQAMAKVPAKFMVCIVGQTGGVYEQSWGPVEQLKQNGWAEDLHVVSQYVTDEQMLDYYAACDCVVVPYRSGFFATSTHLRRASEFGKPIIASDQNLLGDIVRNYRLGLLFTPDDASELRERLLEFMDKPDSWFDEIRRNSERLLEEESWERVGQMYRELFERTTAKQ